MLTVTTEWLQSIEALQDVPVLQLQWWIDNSTHFVINEGDFLLKTGDPIKGSYVIVSGRGFMFLQQKKGLNNLGYFTEKEITGYLPFSRGYIANVNAQAVEELQVMLFPVEKMKELIVLHYELTQALVQIMTTRVREFTTRQQQNEKMMSLGKLSAGLAHELNNPASAIVRGSVQLQNHLKVLPDTFKEVIAIKMRRDDIDKVSEKLFEILGRKEKPLLTLMQRADMEDDLAECLESNMVVTNSQEMAENFIEFGFTCDDVKDFVRLVPGEYLPQILKWINNNLVTEKMVSDIQEASQRIEKLVGAIKNFTHMDRGADMQYCDIHSGIKNTLTMLEYKVKKSNVQVVEEYDTSLPKIKAFVGELNQVWTNLIDNALDAMEVNKKGKLEIKTRRDNKNIQVLITDSGTGIPDEIKNSIFDPFFTTKEIGKGTGLGLDVVSRIVRQHGGSIKVTSSPGNTQFAVCLPLQENN